MVTFTCPLCKGRLNVDTLIGKAELTCGHCQGKFDAFSGPQNLVGQYLYKCPGCQTKQVFSERIEGKNLVCSDCKKVFSSKEAVDLRGSVVVTFSCPLCAGRLQADTLVGKTNINCVHCKGTFDGFSGPQDVVGQYLFNCPLCQAGIISSKVGEAYSCPVCKQGFRHSQVTNIRGVVGNQPQQQPPPATQQASSQPMRLFKALFDVGSAFHATCPKCQNTVDWPACTNCGSITFGNGGFGSTSITCKNCNERHKSCDCPSCGCTIKAVLFFRK